MNALNNITNKEYYIAILLLISAVTLSFPYGFPLFSVAVLFFAFIHLVKGNNSLKINTGLILFYFCILFYIVALLQNGGIIYTQNKNEIINIISFSLVMFIINNLNRSDYKNIINIFEKLTAHTFFVIAIISLIQFYFLSNGIAFAFFDHGKSYRFGTSLVTDYNMFAYAMIAGLIMSISQMHKTKNKLVIFYFGISSLACLTSIIFSGSRRGWVVAVIIVVLFIIKFLAYVLRIIKNQKKIIKLLISLIYASALVFLLLYLFDIKIDISSNEEIQKLQYRFETLQIDELDSSFSERTLRWNYAVSLISESNIYHFLFGSGFNYLPLFSNQFDSMSSEDYPHNPILSTFLYSGLFGVVSLLLLFGYSIYQIFINRKLFGDYFILLYIISWFFIFISSNTIFSVKLFMMILLLTLVIPKDSDGKQLNNELIT